MTENLRTGVYLLLFGGGFSMATVLVLAVWTFVDLSRRGRQVDELERRVDALERQGSDARAR